MSEYVTLDEFVQLKRGYDLPSRDRRVGTVPILGSFGVTGWHDEIKCQGPGVSIGRSGASIGVATYCKTSYWPLNTTLYVQDFKGNDPRFVYFALDNIDFSSFNSGAAQPSLNRNHLGSIAVWRPKIEDQQLISRRLGALDDLMENNRRRIEILEKMARLLYREWFVHFRFPGHEDVAMIDSDLGPIPESWEVQSFADLAEFINGFAFKPVHWLDEGMPIIKIKQLKNGVTNDTPRYHGSDVNSKYFIDSGAVLFSWSADLRAYVWAHGPALLNQHLFDVRPYTVSHLFIFHALNERMDAFQARAQGTTMRHIKRSALDEVQIALPPVELRDEFESMVRPMLDLQLNLVGQVRTLSEARDLLLPRLVSGEWDVAELDLDLVAV